MDLSIVSIRPGGNGNGAWVAAGAEWQWNSAMTGQWYSGGWHLQGRQAPEGLISWLGVEWCALHEQETGNRGQSKTAKAEIVRCNPCPPTKPSQGLLGTEITFPNEDRDYFKGPDPRRLKMLCCCPKTTLPFQALIMTMIVFLSAMKFVRRFGT